MPPRHVRGVSPWARVRQLGSNPFRAALWLRRHLESNTRSGWTVGAGAEYAVGYGWSVKGEYLYVKFDDYTTFTTGPFAAMSVSPREVKLDDHIWRAGMNYRFW